MHDDDSEFGAFENDWERHPMISRDDWLIMEADIRANPCSEDEALRKLYDASRCVPDGIRETSKLGYAGKGGE